METRIERRAPEAPEAPTDDEIVEIFDGDEGDDGGAPESWADLLPPSTAAAPGDGAWAPPPPSPPSTPTTAEVLPAAEPFDWAALDLPPPPVVEPPVAEPEPLAAAEPDEDEVRILDAPVEEPEAAPDEATEVVASGDEDELPGYEEFDLPPWERTPVLPAVAPTVPAGSPAVDAIPLPAPEPAPAPAVHAVPLPAPEPAPAQVAAPSPSAAQEPSAAPEPAPVFDSDVAAEGGDVLSLVAPPPAPPPPAPDEPRGQVVDDLVAGARDLFALGDFTGSLELLRQALAVDPHHAEARAYLERTEDTLVQMYESKLGRLSRKPRVLLQPDEIVWLNLDHRAGFVLAQIDGGVSLEDIFALSGMSRLDTAKILVELLEQGAIAS